MQSIRSTTTSDNCVRIVFHDAVMTFALDAEATFADLAERLTDPMLEAYGSPMAIDVAWPAAPRPTH
jgi:hypothetical protein